MRITIKAVAGDVYDYGQYLQRSFTDEELREPGTPAGAPGYGDIRLQVQAGGWTMHTGSADYDQDHRGAWGAASVPRGCTRAEARDIAVDLIAQTRE